MIVSLLVLCIENHAQTIYDRSNILIGKIESDGTMRDRSNMMIRKYATIEDNAGRHPDGMRR